MYKTPGTFAFSSLLAIKNSFKKSFGFLAANMHKNGSLNMSLDLWSSLHCIIKNLISNQHQESTYPNNMVDFAPSQTQHIILSTNFIHNRWRVGKGKSQSRSILGMRIKKFSAFSQNQFRLVTSKVSRNHTSIRS